MVPGTKVIHRGSGVTGVITKVEGAYCWVRDDESGSEMYVYTGELAEFKGVVYDH